MDEKKEGRRDNNNDNNNRRGNNNNNNNYELTRSIILGGCYCSFNYASNNNTIAQVFFENATAKTTRRK
jgi:hypothetical protein